MQKFKISVSKWGKKYTLILSDATEIQARERVHKEWYSILSIENVAEGTISGHKYIFEWEKAGEIKRGKILWNDIFKAYVKLKKDLWYNVLILYPEDDEGLTILEKQKITKELEEEYHIFSWQEKKSKGKKLKEDIEKTRENKKQLENFYLKKELDDTYKLIDFVLEKIKPIILWEEKLDLDTQQKEKIKDIYNSIIKLKKTTNISKLKEIWELALLKVWKLELNNLERTQNNESRELLKDTNKLLKKIGSKQQFIEKNKDIKKIFSGFVDDTKEYFKTTFNKSDSDVKKQKVDESSYSYIKNERLLKKYKEKLSLNTKDVIKNIFSSEKRKNILLRRRVIQQNILLLLAKKKGVSFSYTFIKKWYSKFFNKTLNAFQSIKQYLFYILIFYSLAFLVYINHGIYYEFYWFSFDWVFYFIVLSILYLVFSLSKTLLGILFNSSILFFIVIFWIINF